MSARVALLGATGMLGRAMAAELKARGQVVVAIDRAALDLVTLGEAAREGAPTARARAAAALPDSLERVINCAAYTDVDGAEADEARALAVNGHATFALAARCREISATYVDFGTDYVFDGRATSPYAVDHEKGPINAYGRSKALGEELLARSGARHLHVRTSWLYAPWGSNFVLTMARLTAERDTLRVVDDQRGRPTSSRHLARSTLALLDAGAEGTLHVTDGGECSWHGLACVVRDHLGHVCEIEPCASAEFPRPAPRPAYSVLDLSAAEAVLGPMPPFERSVAWALDARG